MRPETWLVTGASGFLGTNFALGLKDMCAIGVSRMPPAQGLFSTFYAGGAPQAAHLIAQVRPTVVVNCAAVSSHEACEADPALARVVNANTAGALAVAAGEVGARFVQISTDAVFPGTKGNYAEGDTPEPFSTYGETKLLGEQAVLAANPSSLIVRTNFFGWSPSGTRSILEFFVGRLRAGEPSLGYSDFTVTSLYVGHLVDTIRALVNLSVYGVVHVASSDALTKLDFGRLVARQLGVSDALVEPALSAFGGHATSRARNLSLDSSLAASLLGGPLPTQGLGVATAFGAEHSLRMRLRTPSVDSQ